jgi:class 3 adenylate cyclase
MTTAAASRTCGTEPLANARFCHGCGSPVEDAGIGAEYKQVTVLFTDVVHSMDIASDVGAERLREIMADLADRCAAVVGRYGGTVEGLVIRDIWLLRLRALLAQAYGDETHYREYRDRYRDMAKTLGYEGHIDWAEAML